MFCAGFRTRNVTTPRYLPADLCCLQSFAARSGSKAQRGIGPRGWARLAAAGHRTLRHLCRRSSADLAKHLLLEAAGSEAPGTKIQNRLAQFLFGVHDKGPVFRHRFAQRLARCHQSLCRL